MITYDQKGKFWSPIFFSRNLAAFFKLFDLQMKPRSVVIHLKQDIDPSNLNTEGETQNLVLE